MLHGVQGSGGEPLDAQTRGFFEAPFGHDFSRVRIHHDASAEQTTGALNARALTVGEHIAFRPELYRPATPEGRRLLAHELTHVVQQGAAPGRSPAAVSVTPTAEPVVQRAIGDGHDLVSPRFSLLLDLEAAYDGEAVVELGATGRGVQALQQALYDFGFPLPRSGADGNFGAETKTAVIAFQAAHPPLVQDGRVGSKTMAAFDAAVGLPLLPPAADMSAPWSIPCVKSILCGWSPHTVDVLHNTITLKSYDDIFWTDEEWDGAAWKPVIFPGGGFNTGTEIGIRNGTCEQIAQTLYHEVLHAEQPSTQKTTLAKESYAYRIGEEMSIGLGLSGRPALRSTDAQGKEFADPAKVGSFVATKYPSVPAGAPGDNIVGHGAAPGSVRLQRPNGSFYERPAVVGEKVPGPETLVNEVVHPKAAWTCP